MAATKKDFRVDKKAKDRMGEVCKMAHIIFAKWKEETLEEFLQDQLKISSEEANKILKGYKGEGPTNFCPVEVVDSGRWDEVFSLLGLQLKEVWPKNILGWYIMRSLYGEEVFDFELLGSGKEQDNKILFPNRVLGEDGNPLPFGLAALEVVKIGLLPAHARKKAESMIYGLGEVGESLAKALYEADFLFPPKKIVEQLISVIKKGLAGKTIVLTGTFCPDYEYQAKIGHPGQYEYTFNAVGTGIGLVAKQFVRVVPFLIEFLDRHGIDYHLKFAIGDFEANSDEILQSVGLSRGEFFSRCSSSLNAFREALPNVPMELCLFEQHWANSRWDRYNDEIGQAMLNGDFGDIKEHTGKNPVREAEFIANDGANFYRKWYNRPNMKIAEITRIVIQQAAEYAAMGKIIKDDFGDQPVIQIAGDRPKMQIFNSFVSDHPTICCKRVY